jgi:hypothetical protein
MSRVDLIEFIKYNQRMLKEITKEQFWKLYSKLPQDLKDALFAEETGNNIYEICKRNEVEENLGEIVDLVGQVLLGLLPPNEFQETLEKELKLERERAKKISQEIYRFIFYPVKASLEELYKIEIAAPAQPKITPPPGEKPISPPKKDIYREPIE